MDHRVFSFGNILYQRCYPLYYPLYRLWKAWSDRRERALLARLIRPGMTAVDVGANIGVYTLFLARLTGPSGRVHAFEPAPANLRHLESNAGDLDNVMIHPAAVGEHCGTVSLFISEELNVDHRTFDSGDGRQSVPVRLVSLDDQFPRGQTVDVIKIDVQGYELSVLKGARRLLEDNPSIFILMEFWPHGMAKAAVAPSEVIDWIRSQGFGVWRAEDPTGPEFNPDGLDPGRIDDYCNVVIARSPPSLGRAAPH